MGKEVEADSASEKNAERTKQTGEANKSQLSAASNYYHPLSPLPNKIDHLANIKFGCNLLYTIYDSISLQTCQTHVFKQATVRVISSRFSGILTGMDKMFLVDKPKGLTSSRVVEQIKKRFNVKAGHTGTLDPLATGLLVVLTGRRTKNASLFLKLDKAYEVKAVLGVETDTFDSEGRVLRRNNSEVTREELEMVLKEFSGDIWQTPPPFSAKKMAGRKAYQLARKGINIDIPPKKLTIYSLELKEFQFPYFTFACEVSSGFYVRSLAHDIGEKLGVGAIVVEVRRTRVGPYYVEQAKGLEELLGYK